MPVSSLLMSTLMSSGGSGGQGQGLANMAGGVIPLIAGIFQKKKAKKMLANLNQPAYTIPEEVMRNQKMAEMAANEGLPSQQYNNAMKNIQRNQSNMLAGALDRRSALMALPKIQRAANDATGNLDAQDAQARMQNQRTLYGVGNTTSQYRDKAFNINQMQPYQQKYNYAQSLLGAGNQNFTSGLDKLVAGGGQLLAGTSFGSKKKSAGATGDPNYYGGYNADSNYSDFETGY